MEDMNQIADEIAKGTRLYKAFEHGEKTLRALASLKQTEKETKQRVDALKAEEAEWLKNKAQAVADIDTAKAKTREILFEAEQEAEKLLASASKRIADGMKELSDERTLAGNELKVISDQLFRAKANLAALDEQILKASSELSRMEQEKKKLLAAFGG